MGKVFYSVGGEGRGHATRVRALVENLRVRHDVTIFAPAHAYDLLAPAYERTAVRVERIPGMLAHYNTRKELHYLKTGWNAFRYMTGLPRLVRRLQRAVEREHPDLVLTDFEPALPRAARRCGVPYLSINHQHFLLTYDLGSLPPELQKQAALMGKVVQSYYSGQEETIVSSFYFPPLKKNECGRVTQIGVLLRPEITQQQPQDQGHVVAYLRRFASHGVLDALERSGRDIRVYGLGVRPPSGSLRFYDVDIMRFVEDLASCRALVCTAGNQLVGEALYLGKPVLAMPEYKNYEQYINAHFLKHSGAGTFVEMQDLSPAVIHRFLERVEEYRSHMDRSRLNGISAAMDIIEKHLPDRPVPEAHPEMRGLAGIEVAA